MLLASALFGLSGCVIVADVDADWDWQDQGWTQRTEPVVDVDRIEFNARGTLYVTQGDRDALRLEGHEGALEQLQVDTRDGALIISQSGDNYRWFEVRKNGKKPIYTLEIADLRHINHRGHGEINVGPFTVDRLEVRTRGHAKTNLASINAQEVMIAVSEHGHVDVETLDSELVEFVSENHGEVYVNDANVLDANVNAIGHGEIWIAGRADTLNANLHDHTDLDSSEFTTSVSSVRVRDHSKAIVRANNEVRIDERDHAKVVVSGTADVIEASPGT
jgi:hypothetical protein